MNWSASSPRWTPPAARGQLVVIEGPAGIGKSKLVQDMRDVAKERRFGERSLDGARAPAGAWTAAARRRRRKAAHEFVDHGAVHRLGKQALDQS